MDFEVDLVAVALAAASAAVGKAAAAAAAGFGRPLCLLSISGARFGEAV